MAFEPEIFVKSMSILASTLSIASSVKNLMKKGMTGEAAVQEIKETASPENAALLESPSFVASVLSVTVISEALLSQLADEAQRCETDHVKARGGAKSQTQKDRADVNAAQCMCNVLRAIKKHNKGKLPAGPFDDWWRSYECRN